MDVELAATHEAGHAVMQWFVGLELGVLQMTVEGTNATKPSTCCPRIPLPTLSDLRKRLLVLLAGNAVTQERWPDSWNDGGDWGDMRCALKEYLQLDNLAWVIIEGTTAATRFLNSRKPQKLGVENRKLDNAEGNSLLQDAIPRCREIIAHPTILEAVGKVSAAFIAAPPGVDGVTRLEGPAAIEMCKAVVGEEFRAHNPWTAWIAGESDSQQSLVALADRAETQARAGEQHPQQPGQSNRSEILNASYFGHIDRVDLYLLWSVGPKREFISARRL